MADLNINFNQNTDAFCRLRISNPETIFDSKQLGDSQPLFWDDKQVSGSGTTTTYLTNRSSTILGVGNLTAGKRVRQTFRHFNYQPGKSQLFMQTFTFDVKATGITRRVGQFNDKNGIFLEQTPTVTNVCLRSYATGVAVNRKIAQSDWNIDKLDGTGASGITLDESKSQIFFADYEWLGVGTVAYGFFINRMPIYVHYEHNSNINDGVYMTTPNLPLRYEIENDGTGAAANLEHICSTVIVEGGRQETGVLRGLNRGANSLTTLNDADIYPLIGIRLKATNLGALIRLLNPNIVCSSTAEYAWYIIQNPTITGTAVTWISLINSSIEYCYPTNATKITDGTGTVVDTGLGSDTAQNRSGIKKTIENDLLIGSYIDETPETVFLAVQRLVGTTETFLSSQTLSETY
jgi:hypothetical protein